MIYLTSLRWLYLTGVAVWVWSITEYDVLFGEHKKAFKLWKSVLLLLSGYFLGRQRISAQIIISYVQKVLEKVKSNFVSDLLKEGQNIIIKYISM